MNEKNSHDYDVIVAGTGGVGSAATYHLAKRGFRVLGLDRFAAGHDRGSSHGETRVIRKAYFEHPCYVPLLDRAYRLWNDLEEEIGEVLFKKHELVEIGPSDGIVVSGVQKAAREHGLDVESISPPEFAQRFPNLVLPAGHDAVVERDAGFLYVESCVRAHLRLAKSHGAELKTGKAVVGWDAVGSGVVVEMEDGTRYAASGLIITAGPWASDLVDGLGIKLKVLRKHLHWFESDRATLAESGFPVFFYETGDGLFYGFPKIDGLGLKVSEHGGGEPILNPLAIDNRLDPTDARRIEHFLEGHIAGVSGNRTRHDVCFYTMSPDGDFIIDRHPDYPNVAFAAGLSGHGFKFSSVLGEILSDLVCGKASSLPIEFLGLNRF